MMMVRLPLLLVFLSHGLAEAFVGAPALLAGRCNTLYTKSQAPGLARPSRPARQLAQHRRSGALAHPSMSLMLLAEEDVPFIPMEQQEAIISVLSIVSSALLLAIIGGAVYVTLTEWKNKKGLEEADKFVDKMDLPPEVLPPDALAAANQEPDEEGNRSFRRMAKKEKKKGKS